jgi:hypothetical protein
MPVILMTPRHMEEDKKKESSEVEYDCPVYKTS